MVKFFGGLILGILLVLAAQHDWKGPTLSGRLDGVTSILILLKNEINTTIIKGIDPKAKIEYTLNFGFNPVKIYHDVPENKLQYVIWKENKLFYWDIKVHVH